MMDIGPDIKMKEDNKVPIGQMEFSQTSGENYGKQSFKIKLALTILLNPTSNPKTNLALTFPGTNESPCDFNQKASPNVYKFLIFIANFACEIFKRILSNGIRVY